MPFIQTFGLSDACDAEAGFCLEEKWLIYKFTVKTELPLYVD